jgi:hypothetical protein
MSQRVGYEADRKWRINGLVCWMCDLENNRRYGSQQLADRCGARGMGRCDRVSGGAAVLMM